MPDKKTIEIENVDSGLLGHIVGAISGYDPSYKVTITEENGTVRTGLGNTEAEAVEDAKKH